MFEINIDKNTLLCVAIISVIFLIAMVFVFIAFMCHDKRKYDSISEYNRLTFSKTKTYNENLEEYKQSEEKSGVKTNKKFKLKTILNIAKFLKKGSG